MTLLDSACGPQTVFASSLSVAKDIVLAEDMLGTDDFCEAFTS